MDYGFYCLFLFPLVGILFGALGIPLMRGMVPPNIWYGFRTSKTLSNNDIWYKVNRILGADMIKAGAVIGLTSLLALIFHNRLGIEVAIGILTVVVLASAVWMAIHGFSILRKL